MFVPSLAFLVLTKGKGKGKGSHSAANSSPKEKRTNQRTQQRLLKNLDGTAVLSRMLLKI